MKTTNPTPTVQAQPENAPKTYCVFVRDWWREATTPGWPNNLEPGAGPRTYRGHPDGLTETEAREYCQEYNATHAPGRYSRKAEYESED